MTDLTKAGVYQIRNAVDGKTYVGSAINLRKRFNDHRSLLKRDRHHCQHLQRAWKKHGEACFSFEPLLFCRPNDVLFFEQRALLALCPIYNTNPLAISNFGRTFGPMSEERRARMSIARKGIKKPPFSKEHRRNISLAKQGVKIGPCPEATKEKIRATRKRGVPLDAETKVKLSKAMKGRPWSHARREAYDRTT